jgi:ribonuclease G
MPALDKVGVSHRIASEKERRRLRVVIDSARPQGAGFIVRTAAEGAAEQEVRDDVQFLLRLWDEVGERQKNVRAPNLIYADLDLLLRTVRDLLRDGTKEMLIDDEEQFRRARKFCSTFMPSYVERIKLYQGRRAIFDHFGIEEALRNGLHRHVPLQSGGSLVVEQGEALTAIDVNTGSFVGEDDLETTITKNNIEACHAVAHQLRLRNIGGIIVIDFVDMDKATNRKLVWEEFQKALAGDSQRSNVTKISELGLVEMTRKRARESLKQLLTEPCPACEGRGYIKSTSTVAHEVLREVRRQGATVKTDRIEVVCSPKVAAVLEKHERDYIDYLEKRFHKKVDIKRSGSMPPDQFKVAGHSVKDEEPSKKGPPPGGRRRPRSSNGRAGRRKKGKVGEPEAADEDSGSDGDDGKRRDEKAADA